MQLFGFANVWSIIFYRLKESEKFSGSHGRYTMTPAPILVLANQGGTPDQQLIELSLVFGTAGANYQPIRSRQIVLQTNQSTLHRSGKGESTVASGTVEKDKK